MLESLRVGTGYDVHAFSKEPKPLWVGGVEIDPEHGLAGHSDADVLIHAIVDAILGALNHGDIGQHFPSGDERWKGASSVDFLVWTRDEMRKMGASLINIDSVVIAQTPKMKPHISSIRRKLAETLGLAASHVSVKATTTDHLGFTGRKEGIAAQAVCLLTVPGVKKS